MRSAEHALWDAALATSEARAEFNTRVQVLAEFARKLRATFEPVLADLGRALRKAFDSLPDASRT